MSRAEYDYKMIKQKIRAANETEEKRGMQLKTNNTCTRCSQTLLGI